MGVLFQAFYWDCPVIEGQVGTWWRFVASKVDELRRVGFTALWLPPACKAASTTSMGYDPYDYYDLGVFDQKGGIATWFGPRSDLQTLIGAAHGANMQVYADLVLDHNSGADAQEINPIDGLLHWTKFNPASGKFARDWQCFHPCEAERWDQGTFGGMPDLCHRNPYVYESIVDLVKWMVETVGFDGFRFDFVKGYAPWIVESLAERRYRLEDDGTHYSPFCVGECWDGVRTIDDWLGQVNAYSDSPVSAFDFPLHDRLKGLCDTFGFSLRVLASKGTVVQDSPLQSVTFVDNHDTARDPSTAIVNDKLMAYSFILTHEGYPCVFWMDWFTFGLSMTGSDGGIAALVSAHERYAAGAATVLYVDDDLYVMQRAGGGAAPGLVYVLNNRGDGWNGVTVQTQWRNVVMNPVAHGGHDPSRPAPKTTTADGHADFWAGPRGWAVYAPQV